MDGNVALEKLNYRGAVLSADMLLQSYVIFPPTAHTQYYIFCLSHKPNKRDPKNFLVTDIITINTHFRVRNTHHYMTQTATQSKQNTNQIAING